MSRKLVTSPEALAKSLRTHRGCMASAARQFGVTRGRVWQLVNESPELRAIVEEEREVFLDQCETTLFEKALNGETAALIFTLKCLGKSRGWVEKMELSAPLTLVNFEVDLGLTNGTNNETAADDVDVAATTLLGE